VLESARQDLVRRVRAYAVGLCRGCPLTPSQRQQRIDLEVSLITDDDVCRVERALRENPRGYAALMQARVSELGKVLHPLEVVRSEMNLILYDLPLARKKVHACLSLIARADEFGLPEDSVKRMGHLARMYDEIIAGLERSGQETAA
jgi:hypothetical protein